VVLCVAKALARADALCCSVARLVFICPHHSLVMIGDGVSRIIHQVRRTAAKLRKQYRR